MDKLSLFSAAFAALYVAHHVGDYWVQTDHQARHKGDSGWPGRAQCLAHVGTYVATQAAFLLVIDVALAPLPGGPALVALAVSGITHYLADRREYGLMVRLARLLPGKVNFLRLGAPREPWGLEVLTPCDSCGSRGVDASDESTNGRCWDCRGGGSIPAMLSRADNPSLGTGAWALDQSWHIALGVFLPALIIAI